MTRSGSVQLFLCLMSFPNFPNAQFIEVFWVCKDKTALPAKAGRRYSSVETQGALGPWRSIYDFCFLFFFYGTNLYDFITLQLLIDLIFLLLKKKKNYL